MFSSVNSSEPISVVSAATEGNPKFTSLCETVCKHEPSGTDPETHEGSYGAASCMCRLIRSDWRPGIPLKVHPVACEITPSDSDGGIPSRPESSPVKRILLWGVPTRCPLPSAEDLGTGRGDNAKESLGARSVGFIAFLSRSTGAHISCGSN